MDIVGSNIRRLRQLRGMRQKELADRAKMDPSNISKLERGDYTWTKDSLTRIAVALDVGVGEFFTNPQKNAAHMPARSQGFSLDESPLLLAVDGKLDEVLLILGRTFVTAKTEPTPPLRVIHRSDIPRPVRPPKPTAPNFD